jgi:hypothetical protein
MKMAHGSFLFHFKSLLLVKFFRVLFNNFPEAERPWFRISPVLHSTSLLKLYRDYGSSSTVVPDKDLIFVLQVACNITQDQLQNRGSLRFLVFPFLKKYAKNQRGNTNTNQNQGMQNVHTNFFSCMNVMFAAHITRSVCMKSGRDIRYTATVCANGLATSAR